MSDSIMLGARGGAVVQIHRRLIVLGIDVPIAELREDRFGPGTEAAIRRLQADLGFPVTGTVDAATAQGLGLAGAAPRAIHGLVCKPDGTPLSGVAVQLGAAATARRDDARRDHVRHGWLIHTRMARGACRWAEHPRERRRDRTCPGRTGRRHCVGAPLDRR